MRGCPEKRDYEGAVGGDEVRVLFDELADGLPECRDGGLVFV